MITQPIYAGMRWPISRYKATDADAVAFVTALANDGVPLTGIQEFAINKLVTDIKAAGIWSKFLAIWPIIGGSSVSHKYNLKDPRTLNEAFRLVFVGSPNHTTNGIDGWNDTIYARTFVTAGMQTEGNTHMAIYSRTQQAGIYDIDMGYYDAYAGVLKHHSITAGVWNGTDPQYAYYTAYSATSGGAAAQSADARGFWMGSASSLTDVRLYRNGLQLGSTGTVVSTLEPSVEYRIGRGNGNPYTPSSKQIAFASVGQGLTPSQALAYYNAVQYFQTILKRQV